MTEQQIAEIHSAIEQQEGTYQVGKYSARELTGSTSISQGFRHTFGQ